MKQLALLLLLLVASVARVESQSGRRVSNPTQTAPIQAPLNPPENFPAPTSHELAEPLRFLPEKLLERKIQALDKGTFKLADFHGKVIVINLWASWCPPCRREVPEYEKVRKEYQGQEVEFIGLTTDNPDSSSRQVAQFLHTVPFGFRLGWADREMERTLSNGKNEIPQTLVIDGAANVVKHWTGYAPGRSGERLKMTIEEAIKHNPK